MWAQHSLGYRVPDPIATMLEYHQATVLRLCGRLIRIVLVSLADDAKRTIQSYNTSVNIITDLALTTITTLMVPGLLVTWDKRTTLLLGFWRSNHVSDHFTDMLELLKFRTAYS